MRWICANAAAIVALGALAAPALAARNADGAERAAITRAAKASKLTAAVPDSRLTVRPVKVSTVRTSYAAGVLVGVGRHAKDVPTAVIVLHKAGGVWHVTEIGSELPCGSAPRGVLKDLLPALGYGCTS